MAEAWVSGPRFTAQEREDHIRQCQAFNMSPADIAKEIGEIEEQALFVAPENMVAFYWFAEIDADDFWQYVGTYRSGLDIQTILLDAQTTQREFEADDYKKLKLLGRFVVIAERQAMRNE